MNITLWILQVLLAFVFVAHGFMFLAPPPEVAVLMDAMLPRWFQLFMGVAELLAAVGLTLPGVTRIRPEFVPAAAAGVMIVTISATLLHLSRGEFSSAATTLVLLLVATFVAHGRWQRQPIAPRRRLVACRVEPWHHGEGGVHRARRFANSRNAPGTPAGSCRKNASPV